MAEQQRLLVKDGPKHTVKTKLRRTKYKIKKNKRAILLTVMMSLLCVILTSIILILTLVEIQGKHIVEPIEVQSVDQRNYTYSRTFDSKDTKAVTLTLETVSAQVKVYHGDCLEPGQYPISSENRQLSCNTSCHRPVNYISNERNPMYVMSGSSLQYTITSSGRETCVFLYLFKEIDDYISFLDNEDSPAQGYYNKSDCIRSNGIYDWTFFIRETGNIFIGIEMNSNVTVDYNITGTVVEYNTSKCNDVRTLTSTNRTITIPICTKSAGCAFYTAKKPILVISNEAVRIQWDTDPVKLTLADWIIIMVASLTLLLLVLLIVYTFSRICKKRKSNFQREDVRNEEEMKRIQDLLAGVLNDNPTGLYEKCQEEGMLQNMALQLRQNGLITCESLDDICYDAMIESFKDRLKFLYNRNALDGECDKFINVVKDIDRGVATKIRDNWINKVKNEVHGVSLNLKPISD